MNLKHHLGTSKLTLHVRRQSTEIYNFDSLQATLHGKYFSIATLPHVVHSV